MPQQFRHITSVWWRARGTNLQMKRFQIDDILSLRVYKFYPENAKYN